MTLSSLPLPLTPRERCLVALEVLDGYMDQTARCSLDDHPDRRVDRWFRELASAMNAMFGPLPEPIVVFP